MRFVVREASSWQVLQCELVTCHVPSHIQMVERLPLCLSVYLVEQAAQLNLREMRHALSEWQEMSSSSSSLQWTVLHMERLCGYGSQGKKHNFSWLSGAVFPCVAQHSYRKGPKVHNIPYAVVVVLCVTLPGGVDWSKEPWMEDINFDTHN